jgi:hypothetical protein
MPMLFHVGRRETLYVSLSDRNEITVLDMSGAMRQTTGHEVAPIPVTDAERERYHRR